ncbi:hypothetical protein Moror_2788 [Moniliophthora roreri MCA 2997]|uniref:Uncharacterized protein n=2 Tax=Moniliophthora roreri TaxID=221103 RepID=V2XFP9_MONRO|nr:hypothetical protein Moror_2788 [Moniliophthora roreri MCA 2997]KAI3598092.1 hypothetical protein WG66_009137 [Moniliophthora roreri]
MRSTLVISALAACVAAGPHNVPRQDEPVPSITMSMYSMSDMSSMETTGTMESGTTTCPMPTSTAPTMSTTAYGHGSTPSATYTANSANTLDMSIAGALIGAFALFV